MPLQHTCCCGGSLFISIRVAQCIEIDCCQFPAGNATHHPQKICSKDTDVSSLDNFVKCPGCKSKKGGCWWKQKKGTFSTEHGWVQEGAAMSIAAAEPPAVGQCPKLHIHIKCQQPQAAQCSAALASFEPKATSFIKCGLFLYENFFKKNSRGAQGFFEIFAACGSPK